MPARYLTGVPLARARAVRIARRALRTDRQIDHIEKIMAKTNAQK